MAEAAPVAKEPVVVLVSGAAGQIGYALVPMIASGQMFGPEQPVLIRGLEVNFPICLQKLNGVAMELQDCAYPLLKGFEQCHTGEPEKAWKDIDYAVLVGGFPRKKGMDRAALLEKNAGIFKEAGECLEKYAKDTCKVLVVANPANTNCRVCAEFAPKIPKENFCALTRLDFNRARGFMANHLKCSPLDVKNIVIWGNHSKSQVPDLTNSSVAGMPDYDGKAKMAELSDFQHTIQYRGAEIIKAREASSACSAANAACCNIRDWHHGTLVGETVAMSVWAPGNPYGIEGEVFYSFPCTVSGGKWGIQEGYEVTDEIRKLMVASQEELLKEWDTCWKFLNRKEDEQMQEA